MFADYFVWLFAGLMASALFDENGLKPEVVEQLTESLHQEAPPEIEKPPREWIKINETYGAFVKEYDVGSITRCAYESPNSGLLVNAMEKDPGWRTCPTHYAAIQICVIPPDQAYYQCEIDYTFSW